MTRGRFGTTGRILRYHWVFKETLEGKLFALGLLFSAAIGVSSLDIPAYMLFCGLSGLGVVTYLAGLLLRPTVTVRGAFPDKAVAGQPITGEFELTNRSRWSAYDLSAGFFGLPNGLRWVDGDRAVAVLEPGGSAVVHVTIDPRRRGLYPLADFKVYSTFPFNIERTAVKVAASSDIQNGALLVQPHFHPITAIDVPVSERYQPGGVALSSHIGESPEYIGNREYRPGDPLRHLDHRSWGRLAKPVVREYQEEYYCRIALVLDTFVRGKRRPDPEGYPDLEAAVSLSASIADALARGEYIIDIFAAGPELYVFRAGRHTAHFENVLEILACVDACRENPFEVVTPALGDELANISTVLCVFLDWDASRETLVRTAVESGCSVKVFIVRDGATSAPYDHLEGVHAIVQYPPKAIARGGIEAL